MLRQLRLEVVSEYDVESRLSRKLVRDIGASDTAPTTWETHYGYEAAGRLERVHDNRVTTAPNAQTLPPAFIYRWDLAAARAVPFEVVTPFGVRTTRHFDNVGRINAIETVSSSAYTYDRRDYTFDLAGQRQRDDISGSGAGVGRRNYVYDEQRQVTAATQVTGSLPYQYQFGYDGIGNHLTSTSNSVTSTYSPNTVNQYASIVTGGQTALPDNDANGNLTSDGRGTQYAWTQENRLSRVDLPDGRKVEQLYDGLGRRVRTSVFASAGATTPTTVRDFLYDGWREVEEYENGLLKRSYSRGLDLSGTWEGTGGIGGLLAFAVENGNSTRSIATYHAEVMGNILLLLSPFGTNEIAVLARYEYSSFGEPLTATGALALANQIRFSSKFLEPENGLYYYGYRYYNPSSGRWLSRDPIGENGGNNLYVHAVNAPMQHVDPLGLDIVCRVKEIIAHNSRVFWVDEHFKKTDTLIGTSTIKVPIWRTGFYAKIDLDLIFTHLEYERVYYRTYQKVTVEMCRNNDNCRYPEYERRTVEDKREKLDSVPTISEFHWVDMHFSKIPIGFGGKGIL